MPAIERVEYVEVRDGTGDRIAFVRMGRNSWRTETKHGSGAFSSAEVLAEIAKMVLADDR